MGLLRIRACGGTHSAEALGSKTAVHGIVESVASAMIGASGIAENAGSALMGSAFHVRAVEVCLILIMVLMGTKIEKNGSNGESLEYTLYLQLRCLRYSLSLL